jgi:hypothetical protein
LERGRLALCQPRPRIVASFCQPDASSVMLN